MTGWLILGVYVVGYLFTFRYVVGYLLDLLSPRNLADVVFALLVGSYFTLFWPVLIAGRIVQRWYYARDERPLGFFRAPSPVESPRQRANRLEREKADRDRRIAALEAELGLRREAS